jgi:nitrogen fixation protein FixH
VHIHLAAVACAIIFCVLTLAGCSRNAALGSPAPPSQSAMVNGWKIDLAVSPEHPSMTKPITFTVHLADPNGHPVPDAQLDGALSMKLMDMGTTRLTFTSKGNGEYQTTANSVDMSGPWSLAIEATQGTNHVLKSFDVTVYD